MRSLTVLFGLTADPVHKGHEQAIINGVEFLLEQGLTINQFILVPVYQPNLIGNKKSPVAGFKQRVEMCELVAKRLSKKLGCLIVVSQIEKQLAKTTGEKNYSYTTIKYFADEQNNVNNWIPAFAGMTEAEGMNKIEEEARARDVTKFEGEAGARDVTEFEGEAGARVVTEFEGETGVERVTESVGVPKTGKKNKSLLFMVSADHFSGRWPKFRQWYKWNELLDYTGLLINHRPGQKINQAFIEKLKNINPKILVVEKRKSISVSSTQIRAGKFDLTALSTDVLNYIQENNIYQLN